MEKEKIKSYFDSVAKKRDYWRKRNWYYHKELLRFFKFIIPENSSASVIEIGCGTGDLIASLNCKNSAGIDINEKVEKR
jgi:ubiquinone/menaquinone biosynthesis C-methylase UbiE